MTRVNDARIQAFQRRFPERRSTPFDDLYAQHFAADGLPKEECRQAIALLADELAIPAELIQPTDQMAELLKPLHSGNPFRWIEEWTRAADGKSELNQRLTERLQSFGTLDAWPELPTVGDVVRAWCGRTPREPRSQRSSVCA